MELNVISGGGTVLAFLAVKAADTAGGAGMRVGEIIAVALTAATLVVGVLAYLAQRPKKRLEYLVLTNTALLPPRLPDELQVTRNGESIIDPALSILRICNTGNADFQAADFETDLEIELKGTQKILAASCPGASPADLDPQFNLADDKAKIAPMLINRGDLMELHFLTAGRATDLQVSGRIAGVQFSRREVLPYPPGSGPEGEMLGFDRFMWFVFAPVLILGIGAVVALDSHATTPTRVLGVVSATLVLVLYLLQLRYLVNRRAMWRPDQEVA